LSQPIELIQDALSPLVDAGMRSGKNCAPPNAAAAQFINQHFVYNLIVGATMGTLPVHSSKNGQSST
jgi:hypothetical protein